MHATIIIFHILRELLQTNIWDTYGFTGVTQFGELIMEDIENKAMTGFHHQPKVWKRHVDDTFVVITGTYLQQFFNFLNSIEPTVQFTKEIENDGALAFLNVKVTGENTGCLEYAVHRKPTRTDRYLNFRSDHPL